MTGVGWKSGDLVGLFLLLAIVGFLCYLEFVRYSYGEGVDLDPKRITSVGGCIDALNDMATFPSRAVMWRRVFLSAVLGAAISVWLLNRTETTSSMEKFALVAGPTFIAGMIICNLHAFHNYPAKHSQFASRIMEELRQKGVATTRKNEST